MSAVFWILTVLVSALRTLAESHVEPISFPPSQYWDGNDGQWSSFHVSVGNPAQRVRLLPGTSATAGDSIWVILEEGCSLANPGLADCESSRGGTFTRNASTSWSTSRLANDGLYQLDTYEESKLGLTGNAYYGFDTVQLGSEGSALPNITNQVVAGIATNKFWLGSLGLSPMPINFTSFDSPTPSMLSRLMNSSIIPSLSWGYTAGAAYKTPPSFGSLTLGGYDSNRRESNSISLPFWTDQSRDLLVGLQSITYDTFGSAPLLTTGIYTFINSIVSHMWLPLDVCQAFEQAFGLTWNETAQLYLLNDTTHARLKAQNPAFTLTLGTASSGGNITTITLPYAAFDLTYTDSDGSSPYFPLKRAQNDTQYTLGRVFLQEAYVIADYDRRNFTVGQAAFPLSSDTDIKAILPPGTVTATKHALSKGAIAGIAAGGVVILAVLILTIVLFVRRRRLAKTARKSSDDDASDTALGIPHLAYHDHPSGYHEAAGNAQHEVEGVTRFGAELPVEEKHTELQDSVARAELEDAVKRAELEGGFNRVELDAGDKQKARFGTSVAVYELPAGDVPRVELGARFASKPRTRANVVDES